MMLDSANKGMIKSSYRVAGAWGALVGVGCEHKGPVEKAGEKIDQAAESAKDKLNPEGSAEKAMLRI